MMRVLRNKIASGGIAGYCPASRMATMQWSDELAYLASLNVLQCVMKHGKNQYKKSLHFNLVH